MPTWIEIALHQAIDKIGGVGAGVGLSLGLILFHPEECHVVANAPVDPTHVLSGLFTKVCENAFGSDPLGLVTDAWWFGVLLCALVGALITGCIRAIAQRRR